MTSDHSSSPLLTVQSTLTILCVNQTLWPFSKRCYLYINATVEIIRDIRSFVGIWDRLDALISAQRYYEHLSLMLREPLLLVLPVLCTHHEL
jgi:hypothetical protein